MNEEILLKKYLFNFLRSPDYLTDVNFYLPKFLTKDKSFSETQRVLSWEHERYRLKVIDFAKQFHPQTATWGLSTWEEELGLKTDLSTDLELRRAKVMAKLLGTSPMTVANTNRLVNLFTNDGKAYVDELPEDGVIKIIIPSGKVYLDEMRNALDEMLPAHLAYDFQHIIDIDDPEDESEKITIDDENESTTESAFFIHADFPISENYSYGTWHNALKYDGSARAAPPKQYDGEFNYTKAEMTAAKFAEPFKWWFVNDGKSRFNNEFKHDGAVFYDGLKPKTIKYDDGIDKLVTKVEVTKTFADDVNEKLFYNGATKFDGKNQSDLNGKISISAFKLYNGKTPYNGGDLNHFNGSIKANGNFNFDSGNRAKIETFTDDISGKFSNKKPAKEIPPNYIENFDFIPIIFDNNLNLLSLKNFDEKIEKATEIFPTSIISKSIRYDGAKNYNGGDLNHFNGSIKANGNFTFDSGNRVKVEVIAVDSDGKFSLLKIKKNKPKNYIEFFDFVQKIFDEVKSEMQINLDEKIDFEDGNGNLIISRKRRYDGIFNYRGFFDNKVRKFDGGLNYNGIYIVELDGSTKFDGFERYGGRKNSNVFEYYSDISGNETISDFEKIPIATKTKLGFVIIGENIEVDDGGKISLHNKFLPLTSEKLRNIFEVWRLNYEN